MTVDEAQAAYDCACQRAEEAENRYSLAREACDKCKKRLSDAEGMLSEGRDLFDRFRICEDHYRADHSLFSSPGPESLMRYVAEYGVRDAVARLQEILDTVSAYCACPMDIGHPKGSYSYPEGRDNYDRLSPSLMKIRRNEALQEAGNRFRKDRPGNVPNPDILVRCKVCGKPAVLCRCQPSVTPNIDP